MSNAEARIDGILEGFVWQKPESAWAVARIKEMSGNRIVCDHKVAGPIGHCTIGKSYRIVGRFEMNKYGRTLKASSVIPMHPVAPYAIESFLCTLPGIGEVSARALVDNVGHEKVIDFLANATLDAIRESGASRLNAEKLDELRAALQAEREHVTVDLLIRDQLGELATDTLVRKIKDTWGAKAPDLIATNPWILSDLPRVGFLQADSIAQRLGANLESPERVKAGISYVIENLRNDGHTVHNSSVVCDAVGPLLRIDGERGRFLAVESIMEMVYDERLAEPQPEWVQTASDYRSESSVAWVVRHRIDGNKTDRDLFDGRNPSVATLMEDQVAALDLIESQGRRGTTILTGPPGTGKTTMVKAFFPRFASHEIALCAPTGKAAKRLAQQSGLPAMTIHRLLEPMPCESPDGKVSFKFGRCNANQLSCKLLVVDEASMIDPWLMAKLLDAVSDDCYVLIVGDPNQLASVSAGSVLRDMIDSKIVAHAALTTIKRTNPGRLLTEIHAVKDGRWEPITNEPDSDLFAVSAHTDDAAVESMASLYLDRLPAKLPEGSDPRQDIQILVPWRNKDGMSARTVNEMIQARLVDRGEVERRGKLPFGIGDKVIQQSNDYKLGIVNGDMGRVIDITQNESGKLSYCVDFGYADNVYCPVVDSDLSLAYAVTVHKAQGSEWPIVVMPATGTNSPFYDRSLLYTGLSRAQRMGVMVGVQDGLRQVVTRTTSRSRKTMLATMLRDGVKDGAGLFGISRGRK